MGTRPVCLPTNKRKGLYILKWLIPNSSDCSHQQPLLQEVDDYEPNIRETNTIGNDLDRLIKDVAAPVSRNPHYFSTRLGQGEPAVPGISEEFDAEFTGTHLSPCSCNNQFILRNI